MVGQSLRRRGIAWALSGSALLVLLLSSSAVAEGRVVALKPNATTSVLSGDKVPGRQLPDRLVIRPGRYAVGERSYRLARGAYRLGHQQRIVFDGTARSLLSGIAWLEDHNGPGPDNDLTDQQIARAMMHRRVGLICGRLAFFTIWLAAKYGIEVRETGFAGPINSRETEVKIHGEWQFYDLDGLYNVRPLVRGQPTTVVGFVRADSSDVGLDWLSSDGIAYFDRSAAEMERLHAHDSFGWPRDVSRDQFVFGHKRQDITPMLRDGAYMYFFRRDDRTQIESEGNFRWIPRDEFMARFYP
jgi:hypothetical protein